MKYSKFIKSFCETDKCEYFSNKQLYIQNVNTGKLQADGKLYYCSHPDFLGKDAEIFTRRPIVSAYCPKGKQC